MIHGWSSQNAHLLVKFTVLYACGLWLAQNNYNDNIKDQSSQITITDIIMIKTFEIL